MPITFKKGNAVSALIDGGDWNIVLELVEYFLKDFNVIVYEL